MRVIAIAVLTAILVIPSSVLGQTRRRSTPRPSTPTASAQRTSQVRTQGATRVAEQIKLLTKFTYLLGGINSGIAAADDEIRRNQASP